MNNVEGLSAKELATLLDGMKTSFIHGNNAMAFARDYFNRLGKPNLDNSPLATVIAYELQAGSYTSEVMRNPGKRELWCKQVASYVKRFLPEKGSILEVGVGEASTLAGVLNILRDRGVKALGFDLSWSRLFVANKWLAANDVSAELFLADITNIPLSDNSIDVVYSAHSLEPNGGQEQLAITECFRVARRAVVFIEPIYELATPEARSRMDSHGYIRNLHEVAKSLGGSVVDYRLLDFTFNPLNPSGVLSILKSSKNHEHSYAAANYRKSWVCPLTKSGLVKRQGFFYSKPNCIAYPIFKGIPLLHPDHAVFAHLLEHD